jgi:hypothetical protein
VISGGRGTRGYKWGVVSEATITIGSHTSRRVSVGNADGGSDG